MPTTSCSASLNSRSTCCSMPGGISTVRWKARSSEAVTTPSDTAILAESAISASVKAASLPPGSQVSGSSRLISPPTTPVRVLAEPTISLRRCQTDAKVLLPSHGALIYARAVRVSKQGEARVVVLVVFEHLLDAGATRRARVVRPVAQV